MLCFLSTFAYSDDASAAVGCTLNDPDRDVIRIFPESTGYRTDFISIKEKGGEILAEEIEKKLGDKLDSAYESLDVPYSYYTILKGMEVIGYIHGVNQKGTFGGIQIILASDLEGKIINLYYQKISSPEASKFRNKRFVDQFTGLTLADFYRHDALGGNEYSYDKIAEIKDPSENSNQDFKATLRGIKKNLILLDEFILNSKYDQDYNKINKGGNNESDD